MSVAQRIEQLGSADFRQRARALAELVRLGAAARGALWSLLAQAQDPRRALAAQALAEIADPADADAFADALSDPDRGVRGRAAQGLARIGDPRAIAALVQTINDLPDILHDPQTVATRMLVEQGRATLPHLAPLLDAGDAGTRRRAWFVIQSILFNERGAASRAALCRELGEFVPDADGAGRAAAAGRWAAWLAAAAP